MDSKDGLTFVNHVLLQEWLEGWFKKTPISKIKRGNLEEPLCWIHSRVLQSLRKRVGRFGEANHEMPSLCITFQPSHVFHVLMTQTFSRFFAWAFYTKYPSELAESERVELEDMVKELTERGEIHRFQMGDYV